MTTSWQVRVIVERDETDAVEALLISLADDDDPPALSSFEIPDDPRWQVDGYFTVKPPQDQLDRTLAAYDYELTAAAQIDWIAQSLTHHHQVKAGRFHIYGSHHNKPTTGGFNIKVDAGMAFGTGQHETTLGCLLAIDQITKVKAIGRALDIGCGTGILAIALASSIAPTMTQKIMASDIDPIAIDVARQNALNNRQTQRLEFLVATSMRSRRLNRQAPYDLIVANILAKPLCGMATDVHRVAAPGGIVILSGLMTHHEQRVLRTYRNRGLVFRQRYTLGEWSTLVLQRKA